MRHRSQAPSVKRSSSARFPSAVLGVAFALGFASTGCRQILGVDKFNLDEDAGSGCSSPGYPARPAVSETPGDQEFVVKLLTDSYGDKPGRPYGNLGLNLDLSCTVAGGPTTCKEPYWADQDHTDGPRGVDNASSQLIQAQDQSNTLLASDTLSESSGARAYLVRVRGYNGLINDDAVTVSFFAASTSTHATDAGGGGDAGNAGDASDAVWNVGSAWVNDGSLDSPKYADARAYVASGVLVAHFDPLLLGFPFGGYVALRQAVLKADVVVASNGARELQHAVLAARWPLGSILLFASMAYPKAAFDGADPHAVPVESGYWGWLDNVCRYTDTRVEGNDPDLPCDGLSFGQALHGVPAVMGAVYPGKDDSPHQPIFDSPSTLCEFVSTVEGGSTSFDASSQAR